MYEMNVQSGRSSSMYRQKEEVLDKNIEKSPHKTCCLGYHQCAAQWIAPPGHWALVATCLVSFLYCHLHEFFMSLLQESRA